MEHAVLIFESTSGKKRWKDGLHPVPFEDAIKAARERGVVLPEAYYGRLQGLARALAFTITGIGGLTQIRQVLDTLNESLEQGESFSNWKRKVADNGIPLDLPKHRRELIFRNAVQTAYSRGRSEHFHRHKKTRPYLKYSAVNDSRTRPSHAAMHGTTLPVDDPWWDINTPPNGHACRCTVISLTEKQAEARGGVKPPGPEATPDPGWNYNPYQNPLGPMVDTLNGFLEEVPQEFAPFIEKVKQQAQNRIDEITSR